MHLWYPMRYGDALYVSCFYRTTIEPLPHVSGPWNNTAQATKAYVRCAFHVFPSRYAAIQASRRTPTPNPNDTRRHGFATRCLHRPKYSQTTYHDANVLSFLPRLTLCMRSVPSVSSLGLVHSLI